MRKDLSGKRFGNLTAVRISGRTSSGGFTWLCKCDCGNSSTPSSSNLLRGLSLSCGCGHKGCRTDHGLSKTRLYNIHSLMMRRCYNPKYPEFANYGGRGILVCDRWHDVRNFVSDNDRVHIGKTLDRIDNSKDYSPENCRWVSKRDQQRNRRANRIISAFGSSLCIAEWSERTGIQACTIRSRINRGWRPEAALSIPNQ